MTMMIDTIATSATVPSPPEKARDWAGLRPKGPATELLRVLVSVRVILATLCAMPIFDLAADHRGLRVLVVLGFALYSVWLFVLELRGSALPDTHAVYWADALWCLMLLAVHGISQDHVSLYLFFPVLFISLRRGPRYGTAAAIAMAAGVLALDSSLVWRSSGTLMTPAIALLVLGPLTAALARSGVSLGRRLSLAEKLTEEADPRLGVEMLGCAVLQQVCKEFEADSGVLLFNPPGGKPRIFRCQDGKSATALPRASVEGLAQQLLAMPSGIAAAYSSATLGLLRGERYNAYDINQGRRSNAGRQEVSDLSALLECASLVTTPVTRHGQFRGRIIIGARDQRLDAGDADVLCHVMEQVSPILENAALLERLVADAAEHERTRIGRDLHDSTVQPYIGLKFAIEALARRIPAENPLSPDVRHLAQMVNEELEDLRNLVSGLRSGAGRGEAALMLSVRRQAARYTELFGIAVEVKVDSDLPIGRKLAGELFHMVNEGLSNIRRHSRASRAQIRLRSEAGALVLEISNDRGSGMAIQAAFRPRSLSERAEALGGTLDVAVSDAGYTSVVARIPLQH